METVDLETLVTLGEDGFASGVAAAGENLVVLTWLLGPHRRIPELAFSRGEVAYLVLEGTMRVVVQGKTCQVETGKVLSIGRGVRHEPQNATSGTIRVLVMRGPGRVRVEELAIDRVECPVCAEVLPLEKGDRAGDRFVCSGCALVMMLEDHEGLLRPVRFEPESFKA